MNATSTFQPISTAPTDGTPFVWLHYIKVLNSPITLDWKVDLVRRAWIGETSGVPRVGKGYWMGSYTSHGDDELTQGWWAPLPAVTIK